AGIDRDAPGAADAHDPRLERAAARALHAVADADAEMAAFGAGAAPAFGKSRVIDRVERRLLAREKVAAVEGDHRPRAGLHRGDVRHLFRRHQVAAPDFGAVEAELV